MQKDLTKGNVILIMIEFALPYMVACFLQVFYGMVDLFVVGIFDDSVATSAVAIASQIMHMITVMIVGLVMGSTVMIAQAIGEQNTQKQQQVTTTSIVFFMLLSFILMLVLLFAKNAIIALMHTPEKARIATLHYARICFIGVPFIMLYNVLSALSRGKGNTREPFVAVGVACTVNIIADFAFVGLLHWHATGAALATVLGQLASSSVMLFFIAKSHDFARFKKCFFTREQLLSILKIGFPLCMQDGFIQISFIIITIIANARGLIASCAVGITEKLIGFMFLIPNAFLSCVCAITAQNIGANKPQRATSCLRIALVLCSVWGAFCISYCTLFPASLVALFTKDSRVITAGVQYLMSYSFDVFLGGVQFCFSGFFSGCSKSNICFLHNAISIVTIRIPLAYLLAKLYPATLFMMGLAAPLGSLLSSIICICFFLFLQKNLASIKSNIR